MWNQINLRALAPDASPITRRDALYFVLEQLEAFDEADENEGDEEEDDEDEGKDRDETGEAGMPAVKRSRGPGSSSSSKKRGSGSGQLSSRSLDSDGRSVVQRLDALASFAAHALTDGPVPIDHIRVELADLMVMSLRDMPEHRHLVTGWTDMLRAIGEDRAALTAQGTTAEDRVDVAKQRVLVRMLACAAKAEVGDVADRDFMLQDVDAVVVAAVAAKTGEAGGHRTSKKGAHGSAMSLGLQHESLSVALLKSLPDLFIKFKTDSVILCSLASLPRYLSELYQGFGHGEIYMFWAT